MASAISQLNRFYDFARSRNSVREFLNAYDEIFPVIHTNGLTFDYRLARGPAKRLRDEISPVACFLKNHATGADEVLFPLNNDVIDCEVWHATGQNRKIQITIAQARERRLLMEELNQCGSAPGFLGVTDDQIGQAFRVKAEERRAYSTNEVEQVIGHALKLCLAKKKYHSGADTLLIDAPLNLLPNDRWDRLTPSFSALVTKPELRSNFAEIYVAGSPSSGVCLKLK